MITMLAKFINYDFVNVNQKDMLFYEYEWI